MGLECSISQEDFLAYITGKLEEMRVAKEPFTLIDFIKSVHKDFSEGFETPEEALAHIRLVPNMIKDVMLGDDAIADYLADADLSLKKLKEVREKFDTGVDAVSTYLGISNVPNVKEVIETKELEIKNKRSSKVPTKSNNYEVSPGVWKAMPESFFNGTWQTALVRTIEQIAREERISLKEAKARFDDEAKRNVEDPEMIPYVEFQKSIVNLLNNNSALNHDSRNIRELNDSKIEGVHLTMMSASRILPEQRLPYAYKYLTQGSKKAQAEALKREHTRVAMVVTDADNNILYFDENNKLSTEADGGKMRYMLIRSVPDIVDGKYDFKSSGIQSPSVRAEKKNISLGAATKELNDEVAELVAIYNYINSDPKNNKLTGHITGGSLGYIKYGSDVNTPMNTVVMKDFIFEVDDVKGSSTPGRVYMILDSMNDSVTLNQNVISDEDVEFIASVLTENIITTNKLGERVPMSHSEKQEVISRLILPGSGNRLVVFGDEKRLKVEVNGETIIGNGKKELDMDPAKAKKLIIDTLRSPFPDTSRVVSDAVLEKYRASARRIWKETDEDIMTASPGDVVMVMENDTPVYHRLKKVTYNVDKKSRGIDISFYKLVRDTKDGSVLVIKGKPQSYNTWVKDHTWIRYEINADNKLVPHNGYWGYNISPTEMDKAKGIKSLLPEAKLVAEKSNKKTVSGPSKKIPSIDEMRAESKKKGMGKLYAQKSLNKPITKEALDIAKKWYNEESGLAGKLPFEEAFNIINTGDNRVVAQMTKDGATLFGGSDYSDLYHEAWHGFTQFFLTKEQKTALYTEASKLSGSFTTYKGTTVKFSLATELELEEYLAEEFRAYMLSDKKEILDGRPARNSIFRKLWELLKALFTGVSVKDVYLNQRSVSRINKLYEQLRFGNINEASFDQKNANFSVLYKGAMPIGVEKRLSEGLGYSDSYRLVKMMDSWVANSDVLASLRTGLSSKQLDKFNQLRDQDTLTPEEALELKDLRDTVKDNREHFSEYRAMRLESVRIALYNEILEKRLPEKRAEYTDPDSAEAELLDYAIRNFGDPFSAGKPITDKGIMFYHLTKTRFLTFKDKYRENFVEDAFNPDRVMGGTRAGNEGTLKQHAAEHESVLSLLSGLHDISVEDTSSTLGVSPLFEDIDIINSLARLFEAAEKNKKGGVKAQDRSREALFAKMMAVKDMKEYSYMNELLQKIGSPYDTGNSSIQQLWTGFVTVFNMPVIPLIQTTIDERDDVHLSTVGEAQSDRKSTMNLWKRGFKNRQYNEDSVLTRYILKDSDNKSYLDLDRLVSDFGMQVMRGKDVKVVFDPSKNFDFLRAIGLELDETDAIIAEMADPDESKYRVYTIYNRLKRIRDAHMGKMPKLSSIDEIVLMDLGKVKVLSPEFIKNQSDVQKEGHWKDVNRILDLQLKYDKKATYGVGTPDGGSAQKLSLPSTISKIVTDINISDSLPALVNQPHMSYLGSSRNFMVQRSLLMGKLFNSDLKKIPGVVLRLDNIAGLTRTKNGEDHIMGTNTAQETRLSRGYMNMTQTIMKGWSSYMVPADKSTNYSIGIDGDYINPYAFAVKTKDPSNNQDTTEGRVEFQAIMINYLNGELDRINYLKGLDKKSDEYLINKNTIDSKGRSIYSKGIEFQIFSGVLRENVKKALLDVELEPGQSLLDYLAKPENAKLRDEIKLDLNKYVEYLSEGFARTIYDIGGRFLDNSMESAIVKKGKPFHKNKNIASDTMLRLAVVEATVTTAWIHTLENTILVYGDPMQWTAEENVKRNSMFNSPGPAFDISPTAKEWINKLILAEEIYMYASSGLYTGKKPQSRQFNGTLNTVILADPRRTSVYYNMYYQAFVDKIKQSKGYKRGLVSEERVIERAKLKADKFVEMIMGDSAAFIAFDSYRLLRKLNDTWTPVMETQYRKILAGEKLLPEDHLMFMPLDKYQYAGSLNTSGLDAKALHKYTLMPLIPTVIKGTELEVLHNSMVEQGIDYAMFVSGSKKFNVTKDGTLDQWKQAGDPWYKPGTNELAIGDYEFTKNVIYLEFLKEQVNINNEFKKKVISPSQQRFLLIDGAMKLGFPVDFMPDESKDEVRRDAWDNIKVLDANGKVDKDKTEDLKASKSRRYSSIRRLEKATEILIQTEIAELKREVGMVKNADGTVSYNNEKFMKLIQREFDRSDKFGDHSMRFAEVFKNEIKDFSLLPVGEDVEKMFVSYIMKKIISPKVNGEALNLVSGIGFEMVGRALVAPKITVKDGIEINSKETGLGNSLTNVHYAKNNKSAFDIKPSDKSLKLTAEAKKTWGKSVEAWYKSNNAKSKGIKEGPEGDAYDMKLMVGLITDKLNQYQTLVSEIDQNGGLEFLEKSTHSMGAGRWSSKNPKNMFMNALKQAYQNANKPTQLSLFAEKSTDLNDIYRKGTNGLAAPWREVIDGVPQKTHAGKAAMALHPSFRKLLKGTHNDGQMIKTLDRLNDMIKDEQWLDTRNVTGTNRDFLTVIGPRIPTNNKNTMTFVEVYHFFPPEFGEKIVMYGELSVIAGSDNDGDNLKMQFPNIMLINDQLQLAKDVPEGTAREIYKALTKAGIDKITANDLAGKEIWKKSYFQDKLKGEFDYVDELLASYFGSGESWVEDIQLLAEGGLGDFDTFYFKLKRKSAENEVLFSMKELLEQPENFADLITPNITTNLEDYADQMSEFTKEYDTKALPDGTASKDTSPTKILELPFQLYMQEVFKYFGKGIGISAVHNKFTPLAARVNMILKRTYSVGRGNQAYDRPINILLPHKTQTINGEEYITLSDVDDVDGINILSDINSEELNGAVDGAKNPFLYFLLFNDLTLPVTHLLRSAGTPELTTYTFIANPLIKMYVRKFINAKDTLANLTEGGGPSKWQYARGHARDQMLVKFFNLGADDKSLYTTTKRYILDPMLTNIVNRNSVDKPMNRQMPASDNITGKDTTTIELVESGERTATTRSSALGKIGEFVTFQGRPGKYVITKTEKLTDKNTNDPAWIKEWSKKEQWTEAYFRSILNKDSTVKIGSWQTTFRKLTPEEENPLVFDQKSLQERLIAGKDPDYVPNDFDKAALLHYFELEDLDSLKKLKINSNYDTKNLKSLFNMLNRDFLLDMLIQDGQISPTSLRKFLDDTIIGSFRQTEIVRQIVGKMFPLRNHPLISQFLIGRVSHGMSQAIEDTWDDQEMFIDQFHNQFMGMMFQNILRGFNLNKLKEYKGFSVKSGIPIEEVDTLEGGVHIKNAVIYVDRKALRNAIRPVPGSLPFAKTTAYMKYGAPLEEGTVISEQEYEHYAIELAYLRHTVPVSSITSTEEFKRKYDKNFTTIKKPDTENEETFAKKMKIRTYEEYIRDKALDNIFLPWKLFRSEESSMAQKLKNIQETSSKEFKAKYPILKYLETTGFDAPHGLKNIRLTDNRIGATDINIYHENIVDLQNSDNPEISSFFQMLPYYAIMQSGFNTKNRYSLLKVIPWEGVYGVMEKGADQYRKLFDKAFETDKDGNMINDAALGSWSEFMTRFYDRFVVSNGSDPTHYFNRDKFIDYLFPIKEDVVNPNPQHSGKPQFNKLPGRPNPPTMRYAGVGSRQTPKKVQDQMTQLAAYLESIGYILRSGEAEGADLAFEAGVKDQSKKEIFPAGMKATDITEAIAKEIHEAPDRLTGGILQVMARNTNQIFGKNLDTPVDFVLAWTPNAETRADQRVYHGKKDPRNTGGTGQAIALASLKGIPVINMANPNWQNQLKKVLSEIKAKPEVKVISEDYGIVAANTDPTKDKTNQIVSLISGQITKQAYKENVGVNANWQFSFGKMWSRVNLLAKPLLIDSFAGINKVKEKIKELTKKGENTDKKAYVYDYHELDQEGNILPPITDLAPIIKEIEATIGQDMSDYDAVLGNIYLDNQSIAPHRDTTEDKSAKGYPVIVYTIGNNSSLGVWDDNKGKMTFGNAYRDSFGGTITKQPTNEIPTKNGTIYTFGMDGKGRFELTHTTPLGNVKRNPFPPITLSDGTVITNYTITLTFRRASPLTEGMPKRPKRLFNIPATVSKNSEFPEQSPGVYLYKLDSNWTELVKTAKANPDKLFVFNMAINKNGNQGSDFGLHDLVGKNAVGIPIRKTYRQDLSAFVTDATLPENKVAIDKAIDDIVAKKAQGMDVIFNPNGYGQELIGISNTTGKVIDKNKADGLETFRYLSEQLKERLDYMNPNFFNEKEKRQFKQRLQRVNDQELDDFIIHCRNQASA